MFLGSIPSCRAACGLLSFGPPLSLVGNYGHITWVKLHQPQEQHHPFLPVCAVFLCVAIVWDLFSVGADVGAGDCTQGL